MNNVFKKSYIGDICDINLSTYSLSENWKFVNYLDTGNITKNKIENVQYIDLSVDKLPSRARRKVKQNNIIYSTVRPNQMHYGIIKRKLLENFLVSTGFAVLDVDSTQAEPYFVYYSLIQDDNTTALQAIAEQSTSAYPSIKPSDIKNREILLPPLETQQKIAKVLSAIDDKIELNNSINNNLEQQAQAIFKSWFVDFEPFGGTMPKEWTKRTLDEFCSIFTGRKNANQFEENGENKFFTCGPNPLKINSYIYDGPAIIISGNGAYTGRTRFYNGKFDLYQRTYACTMLENIDSDYIYLIYVIIKNVLQNKIMGGTHGSAIPYIVMNDIAKFELFYNNEIFKDLSQIMKSIVNEIMHNELENEQLAQLRDTLLPKLMSGEIDVSKVEIDDILGNQSADKLYEPANESKLSAEPYNSSGSFASASKNLPSEQSSSTDKLLFS